MSNQKQRLIFGISIQVFIMGLVSLFTDISSEMIQSILPVFIIYIGGNALVLGLISGVTGAISNILKGLTGWLSDKVNRRKPFVVGGYALSNLSKPFIAFSPSWEYVLGLKAIDRFGKGLRTSARDALISYYATEKGKTFGLHRAMDTLGATIGSLLAFLFLFLAWTYSQIIFFSIIPGILAIALIFTVKDVDPNEMDKTIDFKEEHIKDDRKIDRNFIKLIVILGVIEFASLNIAFLQIRALNFIPLELFVPILYLVSNLIYALFSPLTGTLSDKIGRKPVIILGLSILFLCCIILAFPIEISLWSVLLIVVIFIMYGFYMASVDPISRAYIADLTGKRKRGRAYGYYYLSVGFISLAESFLFGLIYDYSITWAFIYISYVLFICIIIFGITDFTKIIRK
ncbi:MAG: MFS transporter [Candidatus Hodarchaeota archaeon]